MRKLLILFFFLIFPLTLLAQQVEIFGYFEPQLMGAKIEDDFFELSSNKLRVDLKGQVSDNVTFGANFDYITYHGKTEWNILDYLPSSILAEVPNFNYLGYEINPYILPFEDRNFLDNAYLKLSFKIGDFIVGKQQLSMGTGYAWNPTNFVGRLKNPADPDLPLEGYWMGSADLVRSFSGPLKTMALTGVLLPVSEDINSAFGSDDHVNVAGKLYLLLYSTDIDLMALSAGSRTPRYGLTVSRNITANFEVHGEAALVSDAEKKVVDADGTVTSSTNDAMSLLAGIRYLTSMNTTWIAEYYHNGGGYTRAEVEDLFRFIDGTDDSLLRTSRPDLSGYQAPFFMRNYFYLRASQKEPFGWLYVTPALFTIVNLDDGSFTLTPELIYTGIENLELRSRLSFLAGGAGTEYGDKVNSWRVEVRVRCFF